MARHPLLVCALLLAVAGRAAALDLGQNQVLIETTLLSITKHEQMADAIDFFAPSLPIDLFTKTQVKIAADIAASETQSVITGIQGDATLAASPVGSAALSYLELAYEEQLELAARIDTEGFPKAKDVLTPVIAGLNLQVAALNVLQGRPDRFSEGKRSVRESGEFWSAYTALRPWLAAHGLPTNANTLFEPFSGGKGGKSLLAKAGLFPQADARADIRDRPARALGALEVAGGLWPGLRTPPQRQLHDPDDHPASRSEERQAPRRAEWILGGDQGEHRPEQQSGRSRLHRAPDEPRRLGAVVHGHAGRRRRQTSHTPTRARPGRSRASSRRMAARSWSAAC